MGRPRKKPPLLDQLAAGADRRLFIRKALDAPVIFEDELGDPLLILDGVDVSLGGLFLRGEIPIRIGARTFLSFQLPAVRAPIRLVGEVVRVTPTGTRAQGMGVRFVEVPPEVLTQLVTWINAGAPADPQPSPGVPPNR